ncbi:hypothetical protein PC9H_003807 [Pleurotus ostreatus]|uniref:Uncharacterized protein n=1 Tax=Pleurotus ostreatus TaxID=5322 RepID=A0A8H7DWT4_PLEOS|nr:uncharacterized protein PC9H_003807 [Pleurotus ostreatus]KAF7436973.1 hypothetical protein PC9H_003807 [Pleurotus ostreatus]KAJ8702798.1 hypothetical protein PTI98_001484 [Pleurotus ostreatus]
MDFQADPELMKEMIKLLGQELKSVKAQLAEPGCAERMVHTPRSSATSATNDLAVEAMKAENEKLKDEIAALRESQVPREVKMEDATNPDLEPDIASTIAALQDTVEDLTIQLGQALNAQQTQEEVNHGLGVRLVNAKTKQQESTTALESLQQEHTTLLQKYRNMKQGNRSLRKASTFLLEKLENMERERDVLVQRIAFDPIAWVGESNLDPIDYSSLPTCPEIISPNPSAGHDSFWLDDHCVVKPAGVPRRLLICLPSHIYNPGPKAKRRGWSPYPTGWRLGEVKSVFQKVSEQGWLHLGRYRCGHIVPLEPLTVDYLISEADMCRIQKQTLPDPYYVSLFHQDMIADMYFSRVLGISCIALQRVGYEPVSTQHGESHQDDDIVPVARGEDEVPPSQPNLESDELADDMRVWTSS